MYMNACMYMYACIYLLHIRKVGRSCEKRRKICKLCAERIHEYTYITGSARSRRFLHMYVYIRMYEHGLRGKSNSSWMLVSGLHVKEVSTSRFVFRESELYLWDSF